MRPRSLITAGCFVWTLLTAAACGGDDACEDNKCSSPEMVGDAGGGDSGGSVDPCVDTPNDPKCLDESTAFFVSAAAPAGGAGTKGAPFKTIGEALAKVTPEKKRVYICAGDYPEQVTIEKTVSLIGGFACSFSEAGPKPRIAPPKGVAVTIKGAQTVALASIEVDAKADAQKSGDSAIGVLVVSSSGVDLKETVVRAGPGTAGAAGSPGVDAPNYVGLAATSGVTTGNATGGASPMCGSCQDGTNSSAGKGADSGAVAGRGSAMPDVGVSNEGSSLAASCGDGKAGANGEPGAAQAGATAAGILTSSGWVNEANAKAGRNGNPGQGGGGGGSTVTPAFGGGSGGCGGCGGSGGRPGANGGSSFAVLSFQSAVTVVGGQVESGTGGTGGRGGDGDLGQTRGAAGGGACVGGTGGHGAGGGGGGGGAGGDSAAIGFVGTEPKLEGSPALKSNTGGTPGAGGDGGKGSGKPGNAGEKGAPPRVGATVKL